MHSFLFRETPWNLFLAIVPAVLAYLLGYGVERYTLQQKRVPWVAWTPLALTWFVFLPNTCYLLTEWRHFLFDPRLPVWSEISQFRPHAFDLAFWSLFFVAYTGIGVVLFTLCIRPIRNVIRRAGAAVWPVAIPFYLLVSLGVYLGLVLRFNSWDLWTRHLVVLNTAWQSLQDPRIAMAVGVFALALWVMFELTDMWVEGFKMKLRQWRILPHQ